MRLVTWNVCDAFRRKFGHLERLKPDIAVLQEVRPDCISYADLAGSSAWVGDEGRKGLAIIAYNGWALEPVEAATDEPWFLPLVAVKGDRRVNLVGVWADSSRDCAPLTLRALADLSSFIQSRPCLIAGDFNQSVALDVRKGPGRRFIDVLHLLKEVGFSSAWHSHMQEQYGEESAATLYWTWKREKPFHIDFAFSSEELSLEDVALGTFETYVAAGISDHTPLTVNYRFKGDL